MYVTHDRALIDHNQSRVAPDWPTLFPLGAELRFLVGKVLGRRSVLVRWSSRVFGRGISVPPMSGAWLRIHEAEDTKHGADV
jgi:hypothetical protein